MTATAGQLVGVTGTLGASEAGRLLLARGEREPAELVPPPAAEAATCRRAGARGRRGRCNRSTSATVSRLTAATWRGAAASSCACGSRTFRWHPGWMRSPTIRRPFAATGGDDYELLVCVPAAARAAAEDAADGARAPLTWLGEAATGRGLVLLDARGAALPGLSGYEHA